MGLFDDVFSTFDSAVSNIFGGNTGTSGSFLGGSDSGGSSFLPVSYPAFQTQQFQNPVTYAQPVMASVPALSSGVAMVGRSLMRFPALAAALVALSQQFGKKFTPEMLWRMLKNNGPGLVGGLIGGAAMNELAIWKTTHKSRRMNPANTRALRRSLRRLKSFDRLSSRVTSQLQRAGGRRRTTRRCGTCRKSPCSC